MKSTLLPLRVQKSNGSSQPNFLMPYEDDLLCAVYSYIQRRANPDTDSDETTDRLRSRRKRPDPILIWRDQFTHQYSLVMIISEHEEVHSGWISWNISKSDLYAANGGNTIA